eukprot:2391506-Prorocentrum_lima.AAC.1
MTSSLVGSEMCIRDRDSLSGILVTKLTGISTNTIVKLRDAGDTLQAVSYTHLTLPTICSV